MPKHLLFILLSMFVLLSELFSQDLPVEVQLDLLLTETRGHIDNGDWASAVTSLEKMTQLGVELPPEFHYNYGRALGKAGQHEEGVLELLIYLDKSGGTGTYEKEALDEFLEMRNTILPPGRIAFPSTMPTERQSEILNASIEYNEANNHAEHLVSDYGQIANLGITPPKEFHFLYGRALLKTGAYISSEEQLSKYLSEGGREATYYKDALSLYLRVKEEIEAQETHNRRIEKERIAREQELKLEEQKRAQEKKELIEYYMANHDGTGRPVFHQKNGKYGSIDRNGEVVVPYQYTIKKGTFDKRNEYIVIKKDDKYGAISSFGKTLIPFEYEYWNTYKNFHEIYYYSEPEDPGFMRTLFGDLHFQLLRKTDLNPLIDEIFNSYRIYNEQEIIICEWSDRYHIMLGRRYSIKTSEKTFVIDFDGRVIVPPGQYTNINGRYIEYGYLETSKIVGYKKTKRGVGLGFNVPGLKGTHLPELKYGAIDLEGKILVEPKYKSQSEVRKRL